MSAAKGKCPAANTTADSLFSKGESFPYLDFTVGASSPNRVSRRRSSGNVRCSGCNSGQGGLRNIAGQNRFSGTVDSIAAEDATAVGIPSGPVDGYTPKLAVKGEENGARQH